MELKIASGTEERQAAYQLRWEVLRKPWQQPKGSETDTQEDQATTFVALENNTVIGTGRTHLLDAATAQVRYMAVHPAQHGRGVGKQLLHFMEQELVSRGVKRVVLHARENAVDFYLANGYTAGEETEALYGVIRHWKMFKELTY